MLIYIPNGGKEYQPIYHEYYYKIIHHLNIFKEGNRRETSHNGASILELAIWARDPS